MRAAPASAALAALAFSALSGVVGCAAAGRPDSGGGSSAAQLAEGRRVYSATCSGCHSLSPRPAPELNGGGLLGYRLRPAEVASFVRVMPLRRALSRRETAAVSAYVAHVEAEASRRP